MYVTLLYINHSQIRCIMKFDEVHIKFPDGMVCTQHSISICEFLSKCLYN